MKPSKYFIEIGSCDFDTLNPLAEEGWGGVIVEPVTEYLDNLPRHEAVTYINAAVDTQTKPRVLNVFKKEITSKDRDFAGMSSFENYTLLQNAEHVEARMVPCVTYAEVLDESGVPQVDFLKIDTEGHDMAILRDVVYDGPCRPKLIKAEHKHIPRGVYTMKNFLESKGYLVYQEFDDIYAIDIKDGKDM